MPFIRKPRDPNEGLDDLRVVSSHYITMMFILGFFVGFITGASCVALYFIYNYQLI